ARRRRRADLPEPAAVGRGPGTVRRRGGRATGRVLAGARPLTGLARDGACAPPPCPGRIVHLVGWRSADQQKARSDHHQRSVPGRGRGPLTIYSGRMSVEANAVRTATVGGVTIAYARSGTAGGEPLLLLHGLGSDHRGIADLADRLPGADVITPDLPGFG